MRYLPKRVREAGAIESAQWASSKETIVEANTFCLHPSELTKDARQSIRSYVFGKAEISQALIQTEPS
jgi:hypothetical protein